MKKLISIFLTGMLLVNIFCFSYASPNSKNLGTSENVILDTDTQKDYVKINIPPNNWDPITASDEELDYYAYPKRPDSNSDEYQDWVKLMSNQKWVKPTFKRHNKKLKQFSTFTTDENASLWSGYVKKGGTNTYYTMASGRWIIPSVTTDTSHLPCRSGQWVGLGGSGGSQTLAQVITAQEIDNVGTSTRPIVGTPRYVVYWEVIGPNITIPPQPITSISCKPGDEFYGSISMGTPGTNKVNFYIQNVTTGQSTSFSNTYTATEISEMIKSAEWIYEKPQANVTIYFPKPSNSSVSFKKSYYYSSWVSPLCVLNGANDTTDTTYRKILVRGSTQLAVPSTPTSTGDFSVTWKNY